jgi:ADP-ribosylglycohydrolase
MKLSEAELRDRIRGAFLGAAIGDALGMPTEFLSRNEVHGRFGYVTGFESYRDKIIQRPWDVGEWTDDFEQALRVAFVLVEHKGLDERALAQELAEWAKEDGRGCGALTAELLRHEKFLEEPSEVAAEVWQRTKEGRNAPNGALMRTFPTALWDFWDGGTVSKNTKIACAVTHADPRCQRSCHTMAYLLGYLMGWPEAIDTPRKLTAELREFIKKMGWQEDEELKDIITRKITRPIAGLKLNESIGYTYKALSAGMWALCNGTSFEDGLLPIINEGGDADTNGTVAGVLLGVKFGETAIPKHLRFGLVKYEELSSFADAFIVAIADRIKSLKPANVTPTPKSKII